MPETPPSPFGSAPPPPQSYKGFAVASWLLVVLTAFFAFIPFIGFLTWLAAFIVIPLTLVFAIIILTRGGTGQGIFLIISAVVLLPVCVIFAPVLSTALVALVMDKNQTSLVSPSPSAEASPNTESSPSSSPAENEQ